MVVRGILPISRVMKELTYYSLLQKAGPGLAGEVTRCSCVQREADPCLSQSPEPSRCLPRDTLMQRQSSSPV